MASVSARTAARRLRQGPTFIQRSRSVGSEQKAIFHNVLGAGSSGVIREFFGASDDDKTVLTDGLSTLIRQRLEQAGR